MIWVRSSSSTVEGTSDQSAWISRTSSGWCSSTAVPVPIWLAVVTYPAISSPWHQKCSSWSLSRLSSSSRTRISSLTRSSPGFSRLASIRSPRYFHRFCRHCPTSSGGSLVTDRKPSTYSRNWSRSSAGTPSSLQITMIGSGNASASFSSTGRGPAAISSSSSSATRCTYGRSASIRRAVNALVTSERTWVCLGGSGSISGSMNRSLSAEMRAQSGRAMLRERRLSANRARTSL